MSNQPAGPPPRVSIGAGTALKIGFFGALGATLFSVVLTVVLGIVALMLAAGGVLDVSRFLP
ncbi:MAG: hypothetical protein JWP61_955 [Friedmanniella sp.]|jgi:hypothetical protein|nr:hypothetical protein [Friedmanniella sp.]